MSIKDLVDGAKHLLNELKDFISDLVKATKDSYLRLYHREWSLEEVVAIAIILVIAVLLIWIGEKAKAEQAEMKKKIEEVEMRKKEKQDQNDKAKVN